MTSVVNAATDSARKKTPLENATTLRGIYNDYSDDTNKDAIRFPKWVLEQDRWNNSGSDLEKPHKFDDTIVVYDDDIELNQVKELVEQREPVNIGMNRSNYNEKLLNKHFGWEIGAYSKSIPSKLYPNIGIYCHARVKNKDKPQEKNVHVMNLIGYAFDSKQQPDYRYFLNTYGIDDKGSLQTLQSSKVKELKNDLIQRYRKIWLKACYICKFKGLKHLWYYGVGNSSFSMLLPNVFNNIETFYNEIFAPAFGIDPADSSKLHSTNDGTNLDIPINFCKEYGIEVLNLQKEKRQADEKSIPDVLFNAISDPTNTLYINAWDPWSIIGNGNESDTSLDGFWGRNSNMSVLGWSMTNSKLLPDITGTRPTSEKSKILSMKDILDNIQAAGSSGSSQPGDSDTPTPLCTIDTLTNSVKNISTECQDAIFSLAPTKESKENILKKHLSVLRTYTQYASNDKLPPGSATIVDLKYYRDNYNYPPDRVKLGVNTKIIDVNSFNKEISFVIQAAPGGFSAANASKESLKNCVYNSLYLANANGVEGIAFPLIGSGIFGNSLISNKVVKNKNELYNLLLEGVLDYFTEFKATNKIKIVLFADGDKKTLTDDNFSSEFTKFVSANYSLKDILKKIEDFLFGAYYAYNKEDTNITKITALVNASNTEITFDGVDGLALAFKNMLGGDLQPKVSSIDNNVFKIADDITSQGVKIKKAFKTAVDAYIANPSAASPPPPSKPPVTPPVVKKPFADVIKDLEGKLTQDSESDADIKNLGITLPDLSYPPNGDASVVKKNLNSAEPTIEEMVKGFENAVTSDDTNFYLGACRSIQAAYDLEMKGITGDDSDDSDDKVKAAKMKTKLLLNLRKNSLLLKVPVRWDYATMQPGEEPEPVSTPEEDKNKYEELQKECEILKQHKGTGYDTSEEAYKLAEKLIPLDEKMEIDKLEKKNKFVEENKPTTTYYYNPVEIKYDGSKGGFTLVVIQSSLNCGRAALSNFFGNKDLLVKGDPLNSTKLFNLKESRPDNSIDMGSICNLNKTYYDIFNDKIGNKEEREKDEKNNACPDIEEYSYQVLLRVLNVLGYNAVDDYNFSYDSKTSYKGSASNEDNYITSIQPKINELKQTAKDKKYLGYLVNLGRGHWICYKREELNTNKDSFFRINSFIDSNITDKNNPMTLDKLIDYEINTTKVVKNLYVFPIYTETTTNMDIFAKLAGLNKTKTLQDGSKKDEIDIDSYANDIKRNQTNNKWKLFKKDVTSLLVKESTYSTDINNQVRIMHYLSNLPSNKSDTNKDIKIGLNDEGTKYGSILSKILSLTPEKKQQVIDIFIQNIKNKLNTLNFITANNRNLRNIAYDRDTNLYEPELYAKNRYYNSLTQTCNYKTDINFTADLTSNGYYKSANTLLESIDTLFKSPDFDSIASPGGGGFKPRHNPITNHSNSRHNSSFKVSSSKTKGKSHNRSHTQRVK